MDIYMSNNNNNILGNINIAKVLIGFPNINYVWCNIYHALYQHYWWNYLNLRCKMCHKNLRTSV